MKQNFDFTPSDAFLYLQHMRHKSRIDNPEITKKRDAEFWGTISKWFLVEPLVASVLGFGWSRFTKLRALPVMMAFIYRGWCGMALYHVWNSRQAVSPFAEVSVREFLEYRNRSHVGYAINYHMYETVRRERDEINARRAELEMENQDKI